jgi:hypothetical protein
MANFRRGVDAVIAATERTGSGKFTPTIYWKDSGDTKYIQFITSMEEIATVLMHSYIKVGEREDGSPQWRNFISPTDPGVDGSDGYDPIIDRFGLTPKSRSVALAVELDPLTKVEGGRKKIKGFEMKMREYEDKEGETHVVPAAGLIVESPFTFYNYLATFADDQPIEEVVFKVTRKGKKTDTQYHFQAVGDAIEVELPESLQTALDDYLEDLADPDNMKTYIDPLPDDYQLSPYQNKGKKTSSTTTRTKRTRVVEDDGDDNAPTRSRRFSAIKRDFDSE